MEEKFDLAKFEKDATENLRRLSLTEINPYFDRLEARLENATEVLKQTSTPDFDHSFLLPNLNVLIESVKCLKLKHSMEGEDRIDFPPTIATYNCGFPTFKDFHLLETDKEKAQETIEGLPKVEALLSTIRWKVLANQPIEHEQLLLRRHLYFTKTLETDLFPATKMKANRPILKKLEDGKRFYILDWYGLEASPTIPVFYRMWFTQDARYAALHNGGQPHQKLNEFVQESRRGLLDLKNFVFQLNQQIDELHPKEIRKYSIGPFYDSLTNNHPEMLAAFDSFENPSALKYQIEMVLSVDIRKKIFKSSMEYIRAVINRKPMEKEVYSNIQLMDRGLIVPIRVKQNLKGDLDEFGNPCKTYGITKTGEII